MSTCCVPELVSTLSLKSQCREYLLLKFLEHRPLLMGSGPLFLAPIIHRAPSLFLEFGNKEFMIHSHPHSHSGVDFIIILQLLRQVSRSSSVLYWGLPGKRIRRQNLDPKSSLLNLFFSANQYLAWDRLDICIVPLVNNWNRPDNAESVH